MRYIKIFENFQTSYDDAVDDIAMKLLDLNDIDLYTNVEHRKSLGKKRDRWNTINGEYILVHIAGNKRQDEGFEFSDLIKDMIIDINNYIEYSFGIKEDGYNIEYYYETAPLIYNGDEGHKEDSFYSFDSLYYFLNNKKLLYLSIGYKL